MLQRRPALKEDVNLDKLRGELQGSDKLMQEQLLKTGLAQNKSKQVNLMAVHGIASEIARRDLRRQEQHAK
eukprot:8621340-Pyramimonas_sp.AAC.1